MTDVICGNMTIASITPVLLGKIGQANGESVQSKLAGKQGYNMGREIKFRAWDKARREMFRIAKDLCIDLDGVLYLDQMFERPDEYKERFILMQYTGLKDKNGKEIFEGDVVKGFFLSHGGTRKSTEYIGIIEWSDLGACFVVANEKFGTGPGMHFHDGGQEYEVIDNIHEHPELLEQ